MAYDYKAPMLSYTIVYIMASNLMDSDATQQARSDDLCKW